MIAQVGSRVSISRRELLGCPLACLLAPRVLTFTPVVQRELLAEVRCDGGLLAPFTLGIARVILRPDAIAWATTPNGVRTIVVESGTLAIAAASHARPPISSAELTTTVTPPDPTDEFLVPAGTAMSFASGGVASLRNPGPRSAVALDVAVFHAEPRSLRRAFTTDDGVSFQLLASASASEGPTGRLRVALERLRVGAGGEVPRDLQSGLTLAYVDAGALSLRRLVGEVFSARAAAAAPYSAPGALRLVDIGEERDVTAGGTIFLSEGAQADAVNALNRSAAVLTLIIRSVG